MNKQIAIKTPMGDYLTSEELAEEFEQWQARTHRQYTGAIGGQYSYSFTATSLGVILVVKDDVSGDEINLTDFGSW